MENHEVPAAVEVDVIVTGWLQMPAAYVFRGPGPAPRRLATVIGGALVPGGERLHAPCLAYVLGHPSAGTILIDTGFHPDATSDRRREFGLAMSLLFRSLAIPGESYEERLRRLNVEPREVERVVMTHLHGDHTSGMRLLPRARFVCTRREWEAAHASGAAARGYHASHLPPGSRVDLLDLEGDGEPHGPFAATLDLLGDGSVRLVSTPGHTAGHMSVLVRVPGGRRLLIVGDAAYTLCSIREGILPLLTASDELASRSLRDLKAFAEGEPEAVLVPSHDPEAWRAVGGLAPAPRSQSAAAGRPA